MKKQSIRKELMERLGINKEEAEILIKENAKANVGRVDPYQIENEIGMIANSMIFNLGYIYKNYDIRHELIECGKDRVYEAIESLLSKEEFEIAKKYLKNNNAYTVQEWAEIFYHTIQKRIQDELDSGIDNYRRLVEALPYKNISRVARTYGMENKIAEYIALNGTQEDFQKFMTDIEPVRGKGEVERKSCPNSISRKIFSKLQEFIREGSFKEFSRNNIMMLLSGVHTNKLLNEKEKQELENMVIDAYLKGEIGEDFTRLIRSKIGIDFDTLKEYLEMSKKFKGNLQKDFITQKLEVIFEQNLQKSYDNLVGEMKKAIKENVPTPEEFIEKIKKSDLSKNEQNRLSIRKDEESGETRLYIDLYNPITRRNMTIILDGTELSRIIDIINKNSINISKEKLEELTQRGIGKVSVCSTNRIEEEKEQNAVGCLEKGENAAYLVGGRLDDYYQLEDFEIKVPYNIISDQIFLKGGTTEMTKEQVERFNNTATPVEIHEHQYWSRREQRMKYVDDFEIDGEQYHIENSSWTNGGIYTVIWKGAEREQPAIALGISSSKSRYASQQTGVNIQSMLKIIKENPTRFSKYYDTYSNRSDACGLFPTVHIEKLCEEIMKMPVELEDKMEERKSEDESSVQNESLVNIENYAREKSKLKEKAEKAKGLLKEYEKIVTVPNHSIE